MILTNGVEVDHIPVNDRGFQYGDGLFETIEILNGKPVFLNQHLRRLCEGCSKLKLPNPNTKLLTDEIQQVSKDANRAVLKLLVTRGLGGRGYRQPDSAIPTRVISLHPYPEYPPEYSHEGINALVCETRLGLNPTLAGIKHLNRLEQIMARSEWDDPDIQEGIMLDINSNVIEGTMTNLFYIKAKTLYTAPIRLAGVAGVMRGVIIQLSNEHNLTIVEHDFKIEDLLTADELFVCNSVIGIWPIKSIGQNHFAAGNITRQVMSWLAEFKKREFNDAA